jgi:valyl-tRNA synthetase
LILEGTPEQKRSAQDTLYTALEGALLLIHPFMPYVTEELWQRLPRRSGDKTRTVCKAAYPRFVPEFDNEKAEQDYDMVFDIAKGIRSALSACDIKDKAEGKLPHHARRGRKHVLTAVVFVHANDEDTFKVVSDQLSSINALVKGLESLTPTKDGKVPTGCYVNPLSSKASIHVHVVGRVDLDALIEKNKKELAKAEAGRKKLEKTMAVKGYETKVKQDVQELNKSNLADYQTKEKTLEELIQQFEKLKTA